MRLSSQFFLLKDLLLKHQIFLLNGSRSSFLPTQGFEIKIAHFTTEGFKVCISKFLSQEFEMYISFFLLEDLKLNSQIFLLKSLVFKYKKTT